MPIKYIDLFAGVGGFHHGLSKCNARTPEDSGALGGVGNGLEEEPVIHAGQRVRQRFDCVYSNEWDKYANSVYRRHYGECDNRDIRTVDAKDIPDFDLLCGGFPCQSFSIAGRRGGFQDTRGTLFFEIARIAKEKRPRLLLLENVKGLLNHDKGRTFGTILNTLDEIGYDVQWQVLNSKDFGVPQNRERVFIVGHLRGTPRPEVFPLIGSNPKTLEYVGGILSEKAKKWLDDGKDLSRNFPQGSRVYSDEGISATLASQAGGLGAKTGLYAVTVEYKDNKREIGLKEVQEANTITATSYKGVNAANRNVVIPVLTPDRVEKRQSGRRFKEDGDPSFTLTSQDRHGVAIDMTRREPDGYRIRKDGRASTLDANYYKGLANQERPGVLHNMRIRRLTPIECERLQGFPSMLYWTDMTRDELIALALSLGTIRVDEKSGDVFVLRGPGGIEIEPRKCGTECNGYLVANISADGVKKQVKLHRVVWISQNGLPPEGMVVCHKNNDKKDNRIDNLYLATPEQNTSDASKDGLLDGRGAKIDFEIAQGIRMDYKTEKYTMRQLAEKYKISKSRIHQVIRMQGWTEFGVNGEEISDTQRYKMMGNAVSTPVIEAIGEKLCQS